MKIKKNYKTIKQCGQQTIKEAPTRAAYTGPGKPSPAPIPSSYISLLCSMSQLMVNSP
jgi:hypothetical protein